MTRLQLSKHGLVRFHLIIHKSFLQFMILRIILIICLHFPRFHTVFTYIRMSGNLKHISLFILTFMLTMYICQMQQNENYKIVAHPTYKLIEYSIDWLQFGLSSIIISHWVHHCYFAILDAEST